MKNNIKPYPKEVLDKIPKGYYCHGKLVDSKTSLGVIPLSMCPFWFAIKNRAKQENGYCVLLGKGDYEINREYTTVQETRFKDGKKKVKNIKYGPNNPGWLSLLWDQCKDYRCPKEIPKEVKKYKGV